MRKIFATLSFTALLAACSNSAPPDFPPEWSPPPDVAVEGFLTAYAEEEVSLTVPQLRRFMEERPLIGFLEPTENISNPIETEVIRGTWPEPEATRRLKLADGHYVIERVVENREDFFKYQIFVFTNAAGRGIEQIVGEQRFIATETGSKFEWAYNILPRNVLTRQFARQRMPEIEGYISGGLSRFAEAANASND